MLNGALCELIRLRRCERMVWGMMSSEVGGEYITEGSAECNSK